MGTVLNSKITINHKKHDNTNNMALNTPWKEHLFTAWELKQKDRMLLWFDFSRVCVCWATQYSYSVNVCKLSWKRHEHWLRGDKFQRVGKFTNMESVNNEDWLFFVHRNLSGDNKVLLDIVTACHHAEFRYHESLRSSVNCREEITFRK